jgi:RNA polymerase sigma-70 factor (ECF subfamily)
MRRERRFAEHVVPELEAMMRFALSLTGQPADAEDLVQDTLLRAYRSIDRFDGRHPRAWLFTIMRRAHANDQRRVAPVPLDDVAVSGGWDVFAGLGLGPEARVVGDAFDETVRAAFAGLAPGQQEVLWLVGVVGLSYAETAEVLGIARGTVMSRLHRARAAIRSRLQSADHSDLSV